MTTQDKILLAACEVFARRGYHTATTGEICEMAAANVASVSYYFRGKQNLYHEVWKVLYAGEERFMQESRNLALTPEDRLLALIRHHVEAAFSPERPSWFIRLIYREVANPSPLYQELAGSCLEPMRQFFAGIVLELLPAGTPEEVVRACGLCIHGPLHGLISYRIRMEEREQRNDIPSHLKDNKIPLVMRQETLVSHIYTFALGGIRSIQPPT